MKEDFEEKLAENKELATQLDGNVDEREKYVTELEQERDGYRTMKEGLEEEIEGLKRANREEAQVRLKFENKVNAVLSVCRSLENKVKAYCMSSMNAH